MAKFQGAKSLYEVPDLSVKRVLDLISLGEPFATLSDQVEPFVAPLRAVQDVAPDVTLRAYVYAYQGASVSILTSGQRLGEAVRYVVTWEEALLQCDGNTFWLSRPSSFTSDLMRESRRSFQQVHILARSEETVLYYDRVGRAYYIIKAKGEGIVN